MSALNVLLGMWLVISPAILDYAPGDAIWNPAFFGSSLAVLAGIRVFSRRRGWLSLVNAAIGAWLFSTAFWLAESDQAFWNALLCGAAVFALALLSAFVTHSAKTSGGDKGGEDVPEKPASESPYATAGDSTRTSYAFAAAAIAVFLGVGAMVWVAFGVFDYDNDFDAGAAVEDVADDTAGLEGRTVTVTGEVEQVRSGAFVLEGATGQEIVVTTGRPNMTLQNGEFVQVTGFVDEEDEIDTRGLEGDGAVVATFLDPEPLG